MKEPTGAGTFLMRPSDTREVTSTLGFNLHRRTPARIETIGGAVAAARDKLSAPHGHGTPSHLRPANGSCPR